MPTIQVAIKDGSGTAVPSAVVTFRPVGHLFTSGTDYPSNADVIAQANGSGVAQATLATGRWTASWVVGNAIVHTPEFSVPGAGTWNLTPQGLKS